MKLYKFETSQLTGHALDWAVAKCEGMRIEVRPKSACGRPLYVLAAEQGREPWLWYPSTNWAQAGPIIEREGMGVWMYQFNEQGEPEQGWYAEDKDGNHVRTGPTPLIAAMRCFCASKLGDTVEIPEELT